MKRLKSDDDVLDRLSELPDSLILQILSLLEMKYVVRTSLLSKRWKYLWTTIPCLRFSEFGSSVRTRNFVNRALMLWRGTKLRKFEFSVKNGFPASSHDDMDLWVLFAKERKVELMFIILPPKDFSNPPSEDLYVAPQSLYECSWVETLYLYNCNLQIPRNLQWDRLKNLKIGVYQFTEGVIDHVVSSAPLLQMFVFMFLGSHQQNLSIRSSSLKILCIRGIKYDPSSHTVLTIWAPNLESLEISGDTPPSKCLLTDVSSLTEVKLHIPEKRAALAAKTLSQILPTIQHVERLELSASYFKMLGVVKGKDSFSPLLNVWSLSMCGVAITIEPHEIAGRLENFPNLKKLVIDWKLDAKKQGDGEPVKFDAENYTESETNTLESFQWLQLRVVKITWYSYAASIFQFIEILLKHAPLIEKMVIRKKGDKVVESNDMIMAAQKLVSLQRSFPNVELLLC